MYQAYKAPQPIPPSHPISPHSAQPLQHPRTSSLTSHRAIARTERISSTAYAIEVETTARFDVSLNYLSYSMIKGRLTKHPLSGVHSSKATQAPTALTGSVYRKVESLCIGTEPPSAWSPFLPSLPFANSTHLGRLFVVVYR